VKRWRPWQFGASARKLPVVNNPEEWPGTKTPAAFASARCRRHPSASVPEALEAVIADPGRFLVKKRQWWDVMKYARLHTGECYRTPAIYHCVARDAWLHVPSGFVVDSQKRVLGFSSVGLNCLYTGHAASGWENAPWIEAPAWSIATAWGTNYAHWLMDSLPRAVMMADFPAALVSGMQAGPFQLRGLEMMGAPAPMTPGAELLRFRELHFLSCGPSGVPHPEALRQVRERLLAAAGAEDQPASLRIYLSREKTRRRIVNGDEITEILRDWGFQEVFAEELDFAAQVRLFSQASAVFGAHGAGTMNGLFQPAGSVLIEAFNPAVWDHAAHRVASLCGVRHFHLFGENASRAFDMLICPRKLEKTLALALEPDTHPSLPEKIF